MKQKLDTLERREYRDDTYLKNYFISTNNTIEKKENNTKEK
jgi:hypothetical protein